jgi:hypothetical protein
MKRMRNCDEQMRQRCCGSQSDITESSDGQEMSKEELLSEKEELEKQLKEVNEALVSAE